MPTHRFQLFIGQSVKRVFKSPHSIRRRDTLFYVTRDAFFFVYCILLFSFRRRGNWRRPITIYLRPWNNKVFQVYLMNKRVILGEHKLSCLMMVCRYKCASNHVPVAMTNGSTLPLVDTTSKDAEAGGYNPFEHRRLAHPTT